MHNGFYVPDCACPRTTHSVPYPLRTYLPLASYVPAAHLALSRPPTLTRLVLTSYSFPARTCPLHSWFATRPHQQYSQYDQYQEIEGTEPLPWPPRGLSQGSAADMLLAPRVHETDPYHPPYLPIYDDRSLAAPSSTVAVGPMLSEPPTQPPLSPAPPPLVPPPQPPPPATIVASRPRASAIFVRRVHIHM